MKNFIKCCLLLALCGPSLLLGRHTSNEEIPVKSYQKMSLSEFSALIFEGTAPRKLKNLIIECPEGSELPFKLTLNGDLFTFGPSQDLQFSLILKKTCYLTHLPTEGTVFSTDMKNWKKADDFFFMKRASIGLFNENKQPTATFEVDLAEQTTTLSHRPRYIHHSYKEPVPHEVWAPEEHDEIKFFER